MSANFTPVVIVGAPRSGTNMLRNALTTLSGVATWPCDEINGIWKHGNLSATDDEIAPELAGESTMRCVRDAFQSIADRYARSVVVEKTCANSLRVPYVDRCVPDAKYVFLVRDGRDCAASARRRWSAPIDWAYTLRKARFVPAGDLPTYAMRFVSNRLKRSSGATENVRTWGPVYAGMRDDLTRRPLIEVCALQWQACVRRSAAAFAAIESQRVIEMRYERFVADPASALGEIVGFLGIAATPAELQTAVRDVRADLAGSGVRAMDTADCDRVEALVGETLKSFGYA